MTAEIVNLRKARKARARLDKERDAAANRAAFGRTKGQKQVEDMDKARAARTLDGSERVPDGSASEADRDD